MGFQSIRPVFCHPRLRALLWWCVPALLFGLALRIAVTASMPYGYLQYDSADFLTTPWQWLAHHRLVIHSKRSFLTPLTFTLPFLIHVPALIAIPLAQHLMGLVQIVMVGALMQLWFRWWRWFIIPATAWMAACPWLIWYERTLMGEAQFLFFTVATVLAATLWARRPSWARFAAFCVVLFLANGTRSEAKLFFGFALLLAILVLWKQWRQIALHAVVLAALGVVCQLLGSQRGTSALLWASVVQYAPEHTAAVPDADEYIAPIVREWQGRKNEYPADTVQASKRIQNALLRYFADRHLTRKDPVGARETIMQRLIIEIMRAHPREFFLLPLAKMRLAIDAWSAYAWDEPTLRDKVPASLQSEKVTWLADVLSQGLTGRRMDAEELAGWFEENYHPENLRWFTAYETAWNRAIIALRLPDRPLAQERYVHDFYGGVPGDAPLRKMPGVPWFYILALAGMAFALFAPSTARAVHIAWVPTMLLICYIAAMIAVTNARFRFAYEPFCFFYLLLFFENAAAGARRLMPEKMEAHHPEAEPEISA